MTLNPSITITEVAGEYIAVPIGDAVRSFKGVIALNEAAAFLLKQMDSPKSKEDLVSLLTSEYQVDIVAARDDVEKFLAELLELGVIQM